MYDITEESIKRSCYSSEVYKRGVLYYLSGRVKNVRIDNDIIKARIIGTYDYNVELELLKNGRIGYTGCECRAYNTYPGYCKHIVALLVYLINEKQTIMNVQDSRISGSIINFFENKLSSPMKEQVEIEITIEMLFTGMFGRRVQPAMSLKIGQKKLYVIKNIKAFVEQMKSRKVVEFGKGFTFDPAVLNIKYDDMPIIDFISEMYEIDKLSNNNADYINGNGTIFKGKHLYLSPPSLDRLFSIIGEDREFRFIFKDTIYEKVRMIKKNLPIEFSLEKHDRDLVLDVGLPQSMVILTEDGKYAFYNGNIYCLSASQRESLAPFYNAVMDLGDHRLRFPEKDREKFVSIVIPYIKSAGKLTIHDDVSSMLCQEPLNVRIYLDKDGSKITAAVNFIYGDFIIDPFNSGYSGSKGDMIIIRDIEGESRLLKIIEQSGFKINKGQVYIEDDDKIFNFITHFLPMLQKDYEVYYSETFKNMKVYNSARCRSSIRLDSSMNFLEFSFSIDGVDKNELPGIFASLKRRKRYYRLPDGSYLPLNDINLQAISGIMEDMGINDKELSKETVKLSKYKSIYLDERLKNVEGMEVSKNVRFRELVQSIKDYKDIDYDVPNNLNGVMREYQVRGFKWLKTLSRYGLGGILADDMGLGKTLQAIAFLLSEKNETGLPSLVVCPTSLIYNWENEIHKFAPDLKTLIITGSKPERESLFKNAAGYDVIITSYPLIRRDMESYNDMMFGYCIIDEAQHIKNPHSLNAKSVKGIKAKACFALTGTPIENNLTELWSIFDFIIPGYLMSHDRFVERLEKPIISDKDDDAMGELRRLVKPFILRRVKKDVLKELPPKIESIMTCELTDEQKMVYLTYLQHIRGWIEDEVREKGFEKSRIQILSGLTRLRQICCHPSLFIENYRGNSGKMDMLLEIVQELIEGGHRMLIFSQFTGALKLIRSLLNSEDISSHYLDGSVEVSERGRMVNMFNEGDKSVFLISLKAGGTGLNLTGADTVIHFDPWWNPAVEDQATDRAYRIGQENTVQVMKLITRGTIEEKIIKLQEKKKELIGSVLQPGETFISRMSEKDIMELFE